MFLRSARCHVHICCLGLLLILANCTGQNRRTVFKTNEPVRLYYHPPKDSKRPASVFVAGSFNEWSINDPSFKCSWDPLELAFRASFKLAPGRYEYKFVVDGQWVHDPDALESAPDPLGGKLGVFHVVSQETP